MAEQNEVQIRFTASTGEAVAKIGDVHEALASLTQPVADVAGALGGLRSAFATALAPSTVTEARKAFDDLNEHVASMGTQIKLLHQGLAERKIVLQAEAQQFAITQNQKFALLKDETEKEYKAELELLNKKIELGNLEGKAKQQVLDKIALLNAKHNTDMVRLDAQAIAEQASEWNKALSMITSSFNSQLRGLLAGTTTWSQAWKKMLGDMIIKFIEAAEQMLQKWIAMELAKTTASTTGALARQAAEESASSAGIVGVLANALKSIFASAGQTMAEVTAAVAPTTGPAAPAIGAAAGATTLSAALGVFGGAHAIGDWTVPSTGLAFLHKNEVVVPERGGFAEGFRRAMGGGGARPAASGGDTHVHIAALDSRSISRFFDDNAHHMVRALQRGLKGGAHLPLRTSTRLRR